MCLDGLAISNHSCTADFGWTRLYWTQIKKCYQFFTFFSQHGIKYKSLFSSLVWLKLWLNWITSTTGEPEREVDQKYRGHITISNICSLKSYNAVIRRSMMLVEGVFLLTCASAWVCFIFLFRNFLKYSSFVLSSLIHISVLCSSFTIHVTFYLHWISDFCSLGDL